MQSDLDDIRESLRRIETGLFGDQQMNMPGLVSKCSNHEERIGSLEKWRVYLLGGAGAVTVCYTLFISFFRK